MTLGINLDHDHDIFTVDPNSGDHGPLFIANTFAITITISFNNKI